MMEHSRKNTGPGFSHSTPWLQEHPAVPIFFLLPNKSPSGVGHGLVSQEGVRTCLCKIHTST